MSLKRRSTCCTTDAQQQMILSREQYCATCQMTLHEKKRPPNYGGRMRNTSAFSTLIRRSSIRVCSCWFSRQHLLTSDWSQQWYRAVCLCHRRELLLLPRALPLSALVLRCRIILLLNPRSPSVFHYIRFA